MQETKLYNAKVADNKVSGDTESGVSVTRPIIKTIQKDLIETHDFLFRLVQGVLPKSPAKPVIKPFVIPLPSPMPKIPTK